MGRVDPNPGKPGAVATPKNSYASDVQNMLEYCRLNGISIPPSGGAPERGVSFADSGPSPAPEQIASLHGQLSTLIRPATPRTLAATAFSWRPLRLGTAVLLVISIAAAALAAIIGYSATLAAATKPAGTLIVQLNYFFAALLGASFSAMFTASPYIRDRTFDPRYVLVYVMRLVLGIIAGLILANLGNGLFTSDALIAKLGTGMIGLLGGYSAEAVRAILDRLVEVLLAVVKGSGKNGGPGSDVTSDILDISQEAASDPSTPEPVRRKLEQLLKKLQKK